LTLLPPAGNLGFWPGARRPLETVPADRYSDFVFTPSDLAEEVDLPVDLKKEVLYLHGNLGRIDHWQLLGLGWNAPPDAVRAAYLEKVKVFHPDRHAGRRLGSYLGRIERIFRALTEARDVLTDEARRAAYAKKTASPEEFARIEMRHLQDEARVQERRARLARANPLVARAAQIRDLVKRGKEHLAEGRFSQAANDFLTVLGLDPRHPEARPLAEQARKRVAGERARELFDRALAAEAVGNRAAAMAAFRGAAESDPSNPRFAVAASRMALEAGEAEEARTLAEQAVRAGPRDARSYEALGAALQAQGNAKEARRALERALELDPALDSAKALLKKARWSFLG
jgi:curved DNA-binding protein CbpA